MEHPGIKAHSATTPKTQKHNQTEIKIASAVDRWIQAYREVRREIPCALQCGQNHEESQEEPLMTNGYVPKYQNEHERRG